MTALVSEKTRESGSTAASDWVAVTIQGSLSAGTGHKDECPSHAAIAWLFVALAGVHFVAQTFAGLFSTDATNITVSRSRDKSFELARANPKQRDQAWYAKRVPQGDREGENSDSFLPRFEAMSADSAAEIAGWIAQVRDHYLALHPRPDWRAAMEKIIRENADKELL